MLRQFRQILLTEEQKKNVLTKQDFKTIIKEYGRVLLVQLKDNNKIKGYKFKEDYGVAILSYHVGEVVAQIYEYSELTVAEYHFNTITANSKCG